MKSSCIASSTDSAHCSILTYELGGGNGCASCMSLAIAPIFCLSRASSPRDEMSHGWSSGGQSSALITTYRRAIALPKSTPSLRARSPGRRLPVVSDINTYGTSPQYNLLRIYASTLTSAADRSVRMPPPLRGRLGDLYTAGTASSVSWRVTHTHTCYILRRTLCNHSRNTNSRSWWMRAQPAGAA